MNHDLADVGAVDVADAGAPVVGAGPVELAPDRPATHQLDHRLARLGATGFIPFGGRESAQANRHASQLDRVAVPNVGDLPDQRPADTLSSRGGPREHQEVGEQGQEAAVHDLLITNVQVEDLDASYTGTTAMAIVPLPLPPGAEARALLHHILEHGDILGRDTKGRTVLQLAVSDWVLDKLMTFDAEAAEFEDGGDDEPDADDEEDRPPVVVDLVRAKVVRRRRTPCLASGWVEWGHGT
jgi:hypothetical protein